MKLMIKVLMIISLISSVMSCKLYEKLLDKVEESLVFLFETQIIKTL